MFRGVHGHVHGRTPFAKCDYPCIPTLKKLLGLFDCLYSRIHSRSFVVLGAQDNEVMVMNQLTSNIHFMMVRNTDFDLDSLSSCFI